MAWLGSERSMDLRSLLAAATLFPQRVLIISRCQGWWISSRLVLAVVQSALRGNKRGIGRGQASALLEVVARRDAYFEETGVYIPICSDGGLANDTQVVMALAMGADFVMMGRYFAMTEESPTSKISINGQMYKPYWGEGTVRAQNWQRYSEGMSS